MNNVSSGTIARTVILALALVNQVLSACGLAVLPIEDEDVESLVSVVWTVAAALAAWWKNNSFSAAAVQADETLNALRKGWEPTSQKGITEQKAETVEEVQADE